MELASPAHVLVVAHGTPTNPALLDAVRDRAQRGPAFFHVLVPNPSPVDWPPAQVRQAIADGERALARALALVEAATRRPTYGSVSRRHDPMDAIEETIYAGDYDEIILAVTPRGVSRWLHLDLPRRVAHLGLPVTTVVIDARARAGVA
jgi:hypothetical protein